MHLLYVCMYVCIEMNAWEGWRLVSRVRSSLVHDNRGSNSNRVIQKQTTAVCGNKDTQTDRCTDVGTCTYICHKLATIVDLCVCRQPEDVGHRLLVREVDGRHLVGRHQLARLIVLRVVVARVLAGGCSKVRFDVP